MQRRQTHLMSPLRTSVPPSPASARLHREAQSPGSPPTSVANSVPPSPTPSLFHWSALLLLDLLCSILFCSILLASTYFLIFLITIIVE
ncbi:uncharacterized protein DS421_9g269350 [Arachis hypogaea]|nr:uncharacterized protein DS421_9g269350 [Arachis hypogaea]